MVLLEANSDCLHCGVGVRMLQKIYTNACKTVKYHSLYNGYCCHNCKVYKQAFKRMKTGWTDQLLNGKSQKQVNFHISACSLLDNVVFGHTCPDKCGTG